MVRPGDTERCSALRPYRGADDEDDDDDDDDDDDEDDEDDDDTASADDEPRRGRLDSDESSPVADAEAEADTCSMPRFPVVLSAERSDDGDDDDDLCRKA